MPESDGVASPDDDQLLRAVQELRAANPSLGIPKFLSLVKSSNPGWLISEKRLRKVLQMMSSNEKVKNSENMPTEADLIATTGLDESINWADAPKVKVKMFSGGKGKGLIAKAKIMMGEVLWQEEPWIVSPDPSLYQYLLTQRMCSFCFTFFSRPNPPLSVPCPHCDTAHFCNRLCLARASDCAAHHPLLCPGLNPGAKDLMSLIASHHWRSIDVVAKIWALWRGARATGGVEGAREIERRIWGGMARVNMEKREAEKREWEFVGEMQKRQWKVGHTLLTELLNPALEDPNYAPINKVINGLRPKRVATEPLTIAEIEMWFSFESFLELLGLANLNQEDSGGLYAMHAHLNHNCEPNIMIRNLPKSFQPPAQTSLPCDLPPSNPGQRGTNKITILARRTIHPGEELCITYVNPEMSVQDRRQALREGYGFWCSCPRCLREIKAEKKLAGQQAAGVVVEHEETRTGINGGETAVEEENSVVNEAGAEIPQQA